MQVALFEYAASSSHCTEMLMARKLQHPSQPSALVHSELISQREMKTCHSDSRGNSYSRRKISMSTSSSERERKFEMDAGNSVSRRPFTSSLSDSNTVAGWGLVLISSTPEEWYAQRIAGGRKWLNYLLAPMCHEKNEAKHEHVSRCFHDENKSARRVCTYSENKIATILKSDRAAFSKPLLLLSLLVCLPSFILFSLFFVPFLSFSSPSLFPDRKGLEEPHLSDLVLNFMPVVEMWLTFCGRLDVWGYYFARRDTFWRPINMEREGDRREYRKVLGITPFRTVDHRSFSTARLHLKKLKREHL